MTFTDLQEHVQSYNRAVYRLIACGRSAPSEIRLARFEESIDFQFPPDFRQLTLSPLGGLCYEVSDDLWPRTFNEPDDFRALYSVRIFGIGIGVPDWLDLRQELESLPKIESDIIPFMARGNERARYCFDLDHQILRWCPETEEREILDQSFYDLLMSECAELEIRWERFKAEEHSKKKRKTKTKKKKTATKLKPKKSQAIC